MSEAKKIIIGLLGGVLGVAVPSRSSCARRHGGRTG